MQENDDNNDFACLQADGELKNLPRWGIDPSLLDEKPTPHPWTSRASGDPRYFGGSDPMNESMFLKLLINLVSQKLVYLISQPRTAIQQNFFDSKHVLKPGKKNSDFGFLPLPSKPFWLKNDHLRHSRI